MAFDDRDFFGCAASASEKLCGQPMDTAKMAENFVLYGREKRAAMLENMDAELRGELNSGSHSLRRRVQLMELRKKMGGVHAALRKAKR